jgi:hypothetical protein
MSEAPIHHSGGSTQGFAPILRVWWPLAGTWLLMAVESPFVSALIARQSAPKENLAAFGVAFALGLLMEAPIIMMMASSVRLVKDKLSFRKLKRFVYSLNLTITLIMLSVLIPPVYDWLTGDILALSPEVGRLTYWSFFCLLPWPAMIGYRRFYQGILIRQGASKSVVKGTVLRLVSLVSTALGLYLLTDVAGASLGSISLSVAVTAEAIAVRGLARKPLKQLYKQPLHRESQTLTYGHIAKFYYPLALTALLGLVAQPVVTLAMNRARLPLESLAVLPVLNGLTFFFRAIPLSFQETIISLLGESDDYYPPLKQFALLLGTILTLILSTIAFTPLADLWFIKVAGLTGELADFAKLPLQIMILTPSLSLLLCWQRSNLIHLKQTGPITTASLLEILTIATLLLLGIGLGHWVGAIAAAVAMMGGRMASTGFLGVIRSRRLLRLAGEH